MKLFELLNAINDYASFNLQEDYDNSGLIYGKPQATVSKGLICLDITDEVIEEAIKLKCDVVISHHPLIFKPLKRITGKHYTEDIFIKAIKKDIAILSVHTNLDNWYKGVNNIFAEILGMERISILQPKKGILKKLVVFCPIEQAEKVRKAMFDAGAGHIGEYDSCSYNIEGTGSFKALDGANPFVGEIEKLHFEHELRIETVMPAFLQQKIVKAMIDAHPYEEVAYDIYSLDNEYKNAGAGMIGYLKDEMNERDFMDMVKKNLNVKVLKHSKVNGKHISKVAICGGSGSFLLNNAISMQADAFITAEVKYNQFFEAQNKLLLIDAGHFETEQFTSKILYDIVSKKITNFALQISEKESNAVHYY